MGYIDLSPQIFLTTVGCDLRTHWVGDWTDSIVTELKESGDMPEIGNEDAETEAKEVPGEYMVVRQSS